MEMIYLRIIEPQKFIDKMKRYFTLLAVYLSACLMVAAQTNEHKSVLETLDQYYRKALADWGVPGMSVAIVKDGSIIFSKGYGELETGKPEIPDGNTLYAIASNTKAFTATMIGQLVDEGKCSWNDKVQQYLPWFQVYDPAVGSQVTLRDLLSHRVGYGTFSGDVIWYRSNLSAEDIIRGARHLEPAFEFRAGYGYSNIMFITAGKVIEAITGKSWFENVQDRILQPLGMTRTTIYPEALSALGNVATPHARKDDRNIPIEYTSWAEIAAMGGLISSVNDVAQWMIFNLDHGVWDGKPLISPGSLNLIMTPHNNHVVNHASPNDTRTHFNGYGLGWSLRDYHGRMMVSHTGGYDGMISAVTLIPDEKLGVVVLTNGMKSPYMAATYQTIDAFMGVNQGKNWSDELLARTNSREQSDTRISDRIASQIQGTKPSLPLEKYTGTYRSAIYGNIIISLENGKLKMNLEHSPELSSTLKHFHYDVFEIIWDQEQAWFQFGTVKFNTDNYLKVTGIDFDVPNDDIFFEELKPVKVN